MMKSSIYYTLAVMGALSPAIASAQGTTISTRLNTYGEAGGLIDMPTAEVAPDAQLSTTVSHGASSTRTTLTFQILPRLSGSFRYVGIKGLIVPGYTLPTYYDRSFDLRYQLIKEGTYRPAVAVGLRDFIGTGLYGSEYIVATKSVGPSLRFSAGVGWGRLGSFNSFASSGTRPTGLLGAGGIPNYDRWFRGPMAAFGGVSYQATDRLSFKIEYSSDSYAQEAASGLVTRKSPWNFGVNYQVNKTMSVAAYALHGEEVGALVSFALNPKTPGVPGGTETAPLPVSVRAAGSAADLGWTVEPNSQANIRQTVAQSMSAEGLVLEGLDLQPTSAEAVVRNPRYDISAQAVGRAARVLSRTLPASVETVTVTQAVNGVPTSSVTFRRSDLEALEHAPATAILSRASFSDGSKAWRSINAVDGIYPRLSWGLSPFTKLSVFDPDNPVRFGFGARLKGQYHIAPGWLASGSLAMVLGGNITGIRRVRPPGLTVPVVRSDYGRYERTNKPKIEHLTLAKFGHPGPNLYSRITVGYLEPMYAGISGELLWKQPSNRLALGVEMNYVGKRNYDGMFGLQNYRVATGHVSAYYDLGNGFHTQLDVGRYLAGDYGATLSLDREFANGWRIGAYATKTNISSTAFGEGSFDKGIRISVPLSWAFGSPTKVRSNTVIQPLTRDGGSRLNVNDRLYDTVRSTHQSQMINSWGKFWR